MDVSRSNKDRLARLGQGPSGSPIQRMRQALAQAKTYTGSEAGLTHPHNRSTIKVRDGGIIDIFVDGNTGIRVDANQATISFFGQVSTEASAVRQWVKRDAITEAKRSWTVRSAGPVAIEGRTVNVTATGDVTVRAQGSLTVAADQDLLLQAGGNVAVKAGGFIDLD